MLQNPIFIFERFSHLFLSGLLTTIQISFITILGGTILGSLIAMCKMSNIKPLRFIVTAYIEIIRCTPLLLQIYIFAFGLPLTLGLNIPHFEAVLIALILNSSAYVAELIRSGIQAVDKGQAEAARSLGLGTIPTMVRVVLPQGVKNILPSLGSEFIMLIKETSLASIFFTGELMTQVMTLRGSHFLVLEPLIVAGALYFIVCFTLSKVVAAYERRLAASD